MSQQLSTKERYSIAVLFYLNVINYMDRFTIAGVLCEIQDDFKIANDYSGLLQTAFLVAYTVCAPTFGYIGDRFSRRLILIWGVALWTTATVLGSFAGTYGWFLTLRMFVGIGESSFSTIAPTIIYDVTYKDIRKDALALFYIAIPLGAGLGFVTGAKVASFFGHWRWGMRATPPLTIIGCILLYFISDTVRGERERLESNAELVSKKTNYKDDLRGLCKNRSYVLSTFGFTAVVFSTGALSWWGPKYVHSGFILIPGKEGMKTEDTACGFGALAILTGLIGVPLGAFVSHKLIRRYPSIDPIICGVGLILGDPLVVLALIFTNKSVIITYASIFLAELLMNSIWTIVADILLSVVVPETRSTAEGFQILISHTFGDTGSPYLVGLFSEYLKVRWSRDKLPQNEYEVKVNNFQAMQYALFSIAFMQLFGGALFLANALFIEADKAIVIQAIVNEKVPRTRRSKDERVA